MELSGEVLAAGLGERRVHSDPHSQCMILLPRHVGCMPCTRGYSSVQLQYRDASRLLAATTPNSIRMYCSLHSCRLRSKPDSSTWITYITDSHECNTTLQTTSCNIFWVSSILTSAQTQPKPNPLGGSRSARTVARLLRMFRWLVSCSASLSLLLSPTYHLAHSLGPRAYD